MFGFYKIAKFYYAAGFHEPGTIGSFGINKGVWDKLTDLEREIITTVIQAEGQWQTSEFRARDLAALEKLKSEHGVQVRSFTDEMYTEFGRLSGEVVREMAEGDPQTKKIFESYAAFRKNAVELSKIQEGRYIRARELPFKWA